MGHPFLALLLVLFAGAAPAQGRREPVRGSAVVADGAPWQGARVHLLARPLPNDERIGAADEVAAVADEKGRFLVQLLPGRHYTAWAVEELADGRYRASFPVEQVIAGRPLELVADEVRARKRVAFVGLDAWRARGKVTATVLSATSPRLVIAENLVGDELLLPIVPGRGARLLLTCDGLPLSQWPSTIDLGTPDVECVKLPVPRAVRVKVVDAAKRPVAGAALSLGTIDPPSDGRELECPLGTTDAKGEATVTLPLPAARFRWHNYCLGVRVPGMAPVRNVADVDISADHDAEKDAPAMLLQLQPGERTALRLVRGDQPFVAPVVCATASGSADASGASYQDAYRHLPGDTGGRLEILRISGEPALLLGTADSLRQPAGLGSPLHPMALLGCIPGAARPAEIVWDLDALQLLAMQVVSADGTPVDDAQLAVLVEDGDSVLRALSGLGTDRSGRIAAIVPNGQQVSVVAWTDRGFAVAKDVAADGAPLVLRLQDVPSLPGEVVGADGKPVPLARVQCYVSPVSQADAALGKALGLVSAPTDRRGAFRLPLYPGLHYSLRGVATADGEHYLQRQWTVGKNEPTELLLDLRKTR